MGPSSGGVDYERLAASYDRHRHASGPFIPTHARLARDAQATRVLELGSGTGAMTAAFLDAYPCELIGVELSNAMLAHAVAKGVPATWIRGSATAIPLARESVDYVFGVYLLHHLDDLAPVFRECRRVLRTGYAAFTTAPERYIAEHPMNRYFPSFARIDLHRFQSENEVQRGFLDAGFNEVGIEHVKAPAEPIDAGYVEKVAAKFVSTFRLMPADEFEEGLRKLRADIAAKGRLTMDLEWESVTIWGHKAASD